MSDIRLNSPDWAIQRNIVSRGSRSIAPNASDFPSKFLTEESKIAEEFTAEPRAATRGQTAGAGALDFSYDLEAGEAAILSIRHPSGALTFHLPVESTSRGARQPNQVRFVVTVRSTDVATGTRGIGGKIVKAVLIKVGKAAADKVTSFLLPKLAAAFERNTWNKHGLTEGWLKVTKETLAGGSLEEGKPVSTERSLLLIHGTFSNAASAYGALASSDFFERVGPTYGERIFAFDHFTVSRTPEENARMLLEGLPDQTTTFDVITHSRGGLVLRNLVERSHIFGSLGKRFQLGRAVLVASPNEGTPLATPQRWHDTVGWLANLLELFPDNPFTTGAAFVANGLVWLARHASGDLPGLHSMDGAGELIAELQRPPGPPADAYSALVANYNPTDKVLLRMLDTGVDQFFGSANDLIVPSEGGWRVGQPGKVLIPAGRIGCYGPGGNLAGDAVTHVNFFPRRDTVDFLVRALLGEQQPLRRVEPSVALPERKLLREGVPVSAAAGASGESVPARQAQISGGGPFYADVSSSSLPPLRITVVNGDLTFAKEPVLIGHYQAARLTGTEAVMDRIIGGTMQHSLDLGLYPLVPGSHQIFLNTQRNPESFQKSPRPEAVIVVGLGEEGKLDAAVLVHSVRQAVMAWAQRKTESNKKAPPSVELCATLIGSGGSGVSAGQSAQRVAEAICEANRLLFADRKGDGKRNEEKNWPRVSHVRLMELYLDRATEAWRALKLHAEAAPDRFDITDEIRVGTGPLPRPLDSGYRGTDYDFITAEAVAEKNGATSIRYTLDTKRARSEMQAQKTQVQLVRDLVATTSNTSPHDRQIGRTLFKLLVPTEIEPFLAGTGEMQIQLDPETAGIPWELLDTGEDETSDRRPWAIRTKLLRKLRTDDFRREVRDAGVDESALIIGEPECPKPYPRIPAAREEADAVVQCLTGSGGLKPSQVTGLLSDNPNQVGPDAFTVISALLERAWRIVHVAGHGAPSQESNTGGVVLSNGTFVGPNEIAAMRKVPELVFLNCCHLAGRNIDQLLATEVQPDYDRVRFASGVAEQLIKVGVRCVIAAGWAVDDEAAFVFAKTFYGALLRGRRFADAVWVARDKAYAKGGNTWAAYQCYGDPDWIFRRATDGAASTTTPQDECAGVASESALQLALQTIIVQTQFQHFQPESQRERIGALERQFGSKWGGSGSVAELFGKAYGEARNTEAAIQWYQRAVNAADGTASMKAAEQLANLRVRMAWVAVENALKEGEKTEVKETVSGRQAKRKKGQTRAKRSAAARERVFRSARASIKEAMTLLEKLVAVYPTVERESIYGSSYKRLALIEAAAGRAAEERRAIEEMKRHYRRAADIARQTKESNLFYPALNYLVAELALHAGEGGWKGLDPDLVEATNASLDAKNLDDADFWSQIGKTDLQLYEALAAGKLRSKQKSLQKKYQDLNRRVSAPWMWSSAYDTAQFVLKKYAIHAPAQEKKAAESLLSYLFDFR